MSIVRPWFSEAKEESAGEQHDRNQKKWKMKMKLNGQDDQNAAKREIKTRASLSQREGESDLAQICSAKWLLGANDYLEHRRNKNIAKHLALLGKCSFSDKPQSEFAIRTV